MEAKQPEQHAALDIIRYSAPNVGGAPPENSNRTKHGLFSPRLPPNMSYVLKQTNKYRKSLVQAVVDRRGDLDVASASRIQTCIACVQHALKAAHWLDEAWDTLSWDQRLAFSREISSALEKRDKALSALDIEASNRPILNMPDLPTFRKQ